MAEYEVVREIFNQCSGNQMRDIFVTEAQIDDVDAYMDRFRVGKSIEETKTVEPDGSVVYDMVIDGLRQRITFQK